MKHKLSIGLLATGLLVGTIGQSIWITIFWNNDAMWAGHYVIAILGMLIAMAGAIVRLRI